MEGCGTSGLSRTRSKTINDRSPVMNQSDFEADLRREGYQVFYGGLKAGEVNTEHSHDWDARVMVIGGEITITRGGKAEMFRVGDSLRGRRRRDACRTCRSARGCLYRWPPRRHRLKPGCF